MKLYSIIYNLTLILGFIAVIFAIASFIEMIIGNFDMGYHYSEWNMIYPFFKLIGLK